MSLEKLLASSKEVKDESFIYFEISKNYDVSINKISAGTKVDEHTHEQEVFNYVFYGEAKFSLSGKSLKLGKGDWVRIEKEVSHSLEVVDDTCLLEFWKR